MHMMGLIVRFEIWWVNYDESRDRNLITLTIMDNVKWAFCDSINRIDWQLQKQKKCIAKKNSRLIEYEIENNGTYETTNNVDFNTVLSMQLNLNLGRYVNELREA